MVFSIVVPIYNIEKYLEKCITSILNQTFKDFELILVVDGSLDRSIEICERYRRIDTRVVVVNKPNGGVVSARKAGAEIAKGDYIVCVDGDDFIDTLLLQEINNEIINNDFPDAIAYGYKGYYEEEIINIVRQPIPCKLYVGQDLDKVKKTYLYDESLGENNIGSLLYSIWTKAVKIDIFVESQRKVPDYIKNGEDILLTAFILPNVNSLVVADFDGYYYRKNPNSLTHIRRSYDLINVTNVRNQIDSIGFYDSENVEHYYYSSINTLLRDMVKSSKNFEDFRNRYACCLNMPENSSKYKFKSIDNKDRIKYFLIKNKCWMLFYFLNRR